MAPLAGSSVRCPWAMDQRNDDRDALAHPLGGLGLLGPDGSHDAHDVRGGDLVDRFVADSRVGVGVQRGAPDLSGAAAVLPGGGVDSDDLLGGRREGRHAAVAGVAALFDGLAVLERLAPRLGEHHDWVGAEAEVGDLSVNADALAPSLRDAPVLGRLDEQRKPVPAAGRRRNGQRVRRSPRSAATAPGFAARFGSLSAITDQMLPTLSLASREQVIPSGTSWSICQAADLRLMDSMKASCGLMRPQSCGAGGNRTPVRREVAASDTTIPGYCFAGGTPPGRLPVRAPPDLSPVSMVFPTVSGLSLPSSPASVARLQRTGPACPRGGRSYLTDQSGDQAARSTGSSLPCHWCPVFGV